VIRHPRYKELVGVVKPQPLGEAIEALIESKRSANKRAPYVKNLRGMLNQFAQGRGEVSIAAIRTADIEEWLAEHATTPGYRHTRRRALALMAAKLGFPSWPKDILRHTCASMLMATWEDRLPRRSPSPSRASREGKVAASLGNSPTIVHAHYRELVNRAEAKRFWGI
jgi:hypothetical protein